jgi:hypothetical protein
LAPASGKRSGWKANLVGGVTTYLIKEGGGIHLPIPVHSGKILTGLLKKLDL